MRLLLEKRFSKAWDTYILEVEVQHIDHWSLIQGRSPKEHGRGFNLNTSYKWYSEGILKLLQVPRNNSDMMKGEVGKARFREQVENPAKLLFGATDLFDQAMVRFAHSLCEQRHDKLHSSAISVLRALLSLRKMDESTNTSSSGQTELCGAFATLLAATCTVVSSKGRPIDKMASALVVILRGAFQFLYSHDDGKARGPAVLLLFLADLIESVSAFQVIPLPRALSLEANSAIPIIAVPGPRQNFPLVQLTGVVQVCGEFLKMFGVLPSDMTSSSAAGSAAEAWNRLVDVVGGQGSHETLFVKGIGVAAAICTPEAQRPLILSLTGMLTSLLDVIADRTKKANEKVGAVLSVVLNLDADDASSVNVRRILSLLIECVSGDFSSLPKLLELLGAPLPPEIEETSVMCLNVLSRLSDGKQLSAHAVATATSAMVMDKLVNELFDQVDVDHQGFITMHRFVSLVNYIGISLSSTEAKAMFEQFDSSGDGQIDRQEFRKAIDIIKQKVVDMIVSRMELRPGQLVVRVCVILTVLAAFLSFILLGTTVFSDGAVFSAVVGGIMPMSSKAVAFLTAGTTSIVDEAERILDKAF